MLKTERLAWSPLCRIGGRKLESIAEGMERTLAKAVAFFAFFDLTTLWRFQNIGCVLVLNAPAVTDALNTQVMGDGNDSRDI